MPLFEFLCSDCQQKFEFLTSSTVRAPEHCPHCHSTKLVKQLSAFAVGSSAQNSSPCHSESSCQNCPGAGGGLSGGCPFARG